VSAAPGVELADSGNAADHPSTPVPPAALETTVLVKEPLASPLSEQAKTK
jgi:hypothetical protein